MKLATLAKPMAHTSACYFMLHWLIVPKLMDICDAQSRGSIVMLLFEVLIYTYIPIDNVGLGGCMFITISDSSCVML